MPLFEETVTKPDHPQFPNLVDFFAERDGQPKTNVTKRITAAMRQGTRFILDLADHTVKNVREDRLEMKPRTTPLDEKFDSTETVSDRWSTRPFPRHS